MSKLIPIQIINKYKDVNLFDRLEDFKSIDLANNKNIKKILIIKWGGMGDLVMASGVMEDIIYSFPHRIIDLNTRPQWQPLFEDDKRFNKVWGSNNKSLGTFIHLCKWLKFVISQKYDLIIDLQTNDRTRIYLSLLKFFQKKSMQIIGNHAVFPYTIKPRLSVKIHNPLQMMQRTINTIGIEARTFRPIINIGNAIKNSSLRIIKNNNLTAKSYCIFICGSNPRGHLKRWGIKNYTELSFLVENKYKIPVVLIGGTEDEEECLTISKGNKNIVNLCNKTSLTELIEIFNQASFIVSNDTGPAHLASTTLTPMIVITGPTDPKKVKPLGGQILAIQPEITCKNCYKKECSHHSCMIGLSPNEVINSIGEVL